MKSLITDSFSFENLLHTRGQIQVGTLVYRSVVPPPLYPTIKECRKYKRHKVANNNIVLTNLNVCYRSKCYVIDKRRMRTHMPHDHATNFDHPDAIDIRRLANDIAALKTGNPITNLYTI